MARRPSFLRRASVNADRRQRQAREADSAARGAFRWAAIGLAIAMVLIVTVGFGGNAALIQNVAALSGLNQPVLLGWSWLEILAALCVPAIAAIVLYRDWRKTQL